MANIIKGYVSESNCIIEDIQGNKNPAILGKFKAVMSKVNKISQNGTYYPETLWDKVLGSDKFQEKLSKKLIVGEVDHPAEAEGKLMRTAFFINKLIKEGEDIIGECEIVNTPSGQVLNSLIRGGMKVGFSTRALGEEQLVREESTGKSYKEVKSDGFDLIGIDAVLDPSHIGSEIINLSESKKKTLTESLKKIKDSLADEIIAESEKQSYKQVISSLKLETDTLKKLIENKEFELKKTKEELIESNKKLESRIKLINESANQKSDMIISKDKTIVLLNESIKAKEQLVEAKDKTIVGLKESINDLNTRLQIFENEIKEKDQLLEQTEEQIQTIKESKKSIKYEININKEAISGNKVNKDSLVSRIAKSTAHKM